MIKTPPLSGRRFQLLVKIRVFMSLRRSTLPCVVASFLSCFAFAALAYDVRDRAEGDWGFEDVPDMTCLQNPSRLRFGKDGLEAKFTWPKSVSYSDGTVLDAVTFSVTSIDGNRINMRRDRDGETGYLILSADAMSYQFGLDSERRTGIGGSVFVRCDKLVS